MMRSAGYIALGVVAYTAFVVWTFPADRALSVGRNMLPDVYFQNVSGTLWNGRAGRMKVSDQNFERVSWNIRLLPLLFGRLNIDFGFDGAGRSGEGVVSLGLMGGLSLKNVKATVPVADVDQYLGLGPVRLSGMFDLDLRRARIEDNMLSSAEGVVRWQNARVVSPMAQELGGFLMELSPDENGVVGQLKDDGGNVQLDGMVHLDPTGEYTFNGTIAARGDSRSPLARAMSTFGRPGPDGQVSIEYAGNVNEGFF